MKSHAAFLRLRAQHQTRNTAMSPIVDRLRGTQLLDSRKLSLPARLTLGGLFYFRTWAHPGLPKGSTMTTAQKSKTKAKPRGKPIAKGQVLNPGGRPKKTPQELDLIAACKEKTPDALATIVDIMTNGEKEQTRLAAALSIIERAYGKPVQPQDVSLSGVVISRIERVIVDPKK